MKDEYYYKYKKYKTKYLLLGGAKVKECNGDAIVKGGIYDSNITVNDMFKHYGNCVDSDDFPNFVGLSKDSNIQIIDLIKVGFTYEQLLKSGIDSQDNINTIIWSNINQVDIKFLSEAIKKGYTSLLSNINKLNKEIPMIDFDKIIKIIEDIFLDTNSSSNYRYNLIKNIIIKINKFDPKDIKDFEYKMKKIWKVLEKNHIYKNDIMK